MKKDTAIRGMKDHHAASTDVKMNPSKEPVCVPVKIRVTPSRACKVPSTKKTVQRAPVKCPLSTSPVMLLKDADLQVVVIKNSSPRAAFVAVLFGLVNPVGEAANGRWSDVKF